MTLETAKQILEEMPQDKSVQYKYRLKNLSRIREAEAICRGGFTFCEYEDGDRVYVWLKVFPTETDEESSTIQAVNEYRKKKELRNRSSKKQEEQISSPTPALQQKEVAPQIVESEPKESNPLSNIVSKIKKKFEEFVKKMDGIVEE